MNNDQKKTTTENTNDHKVQEHKNEQEQVIVNSDIIIDCTTEQIKAAATAAADNFQIDNEFIYEPTSGLYYHRLTGYYYNAEHGLYYDGNTGCYYNYDQYKNEYVFHSQVEETPELTYTKRKIGKKKPKNCLLKNVDKQTPPAIVTIVGKPSKNNAIEVNSSESSNDDCCKIQVNKKPKKIYNDDETKNMYNDDKTKNKEHNHIDNDEIKKEEKSNDGDDGDGDLEEGEVPSSDESEQLVNDGDDNDDDDDDDDVVFVTVGGEDEVRVIDDSSDDDQDEAIIDSNVIDLTVNYPPALRIVVQDTKLSTLKIGTLFVITCVGGTLGREGIHDVLIPDENISKYHLKFSYDTKKQIYQCIDFGSRNGTLLNGVRMSSAKQESDPLELVHGSVIELSQTKLLCHIHNGANTCDKCEPGLTMINIKPIPLKPNQNSNNNDGVQQKIELYCSHKEQLKNIRKKYGLKEDKYIIHKLDKKIKNSSEERRKLIGSSHTSEKTDYASVDKAISANNIGFKMMSKLGWKEGEKIGKNDSGLLDPIIPQLMQHKQGFGYPSNIGASSLNSNVNVNTKKKLSKKELHHEKMKNRYQQKFIQQSTGSNQESIIDHEYEYDVDDDYDEVFKKNKKIDIIDSSIKSSNKKIIINVKKCSASTVVIPNAIDIPNEDKTHNNNNNNNNDRNDDK